MAVRDVAKAERFAPIIEAVAASDPEIFAIVEQDMYGCDVEYPFPIAKRTRELTEIRTVDAPDVGEATRRLVELGLRVSEIAPPRLPRPFSTPTT